MYDKYDISDNPEWNKCLNLLLDDDYSEIETNAPDQFFTKKKGKRIQIEGIPPMTPERYMQGIKEGLVPHVKSPWPFKENSYLFEGPLRYHGGEQFIRGRCHIVLPPAADYPQVTIAKKSTALPSLPSIAGRGSMSTEMMVFLLVAAKANLTTVLSGGTGSGKTTMLEAFVKNFPLDQRIGVAEDAPELYLSQQNTTYLHAVPWQPGMDPNDVATLSWAVSQFQRMRTDKLIVGETRGKEFQDFLIAANSGMDGSLTTLHANNPVQALDKMTAFALAASPRPIRTVNNDIATAIDIIIQLIYLPDGRYRMAAIQEITNTLGAAEDAKITTNQLYGYNPRSDSFIKTNMPTDALRSTLENRGINMQAFFQASIGSESGGHRSDEIAQELLELAVPGGSIYPPDMQPAALPRTI